MKLKRSPSTDTIERSTSEVVEKNPITIKIILDTQLLIERDLDITLHIVKYEFMMTTYKEYLEAKQVYINVQRLGLHKIACRFLIFPWTCIIKWILSHIDEKTMILNRISAQRLASFVVYEFSAYASFSLARSLHGFSLICSH